MAGQIIKKKAFELTAENGTLIGFIAGIAIPIVLLLLTGGRFGVFRLLFYLFLSLVGVVAFGLYSNQKQARLFWAGVMVACAFIMLFVLPVAVVINVGLVIGSGLLLLKVLASLREM